MNQLGWIMSEGGPLICMEASYMPSWKGSHALSIQSTDTANDYERAGRVFDYLEALPLSEGQALVFGEGPLDTSIWYSSDGQFFVVRIFAGEGDIDLDAVMRALRPDAFDHPSETLDFSVSTSGLVIFDSAEEGSEPAKSCLSFSIEPGRYRILTQPYKPNPLISLVLHRFDLIVKLSENVRP